MEAGALYSISGKVEDRGANIPVSGYFGTKAAD